MEKTYQYLGEFPDRHFPMGIHFNPTYTTDSQAEQEFIENLSKFKSGGIAVIGDAPVEHDKPEMEVSFKYSRRDLFEGDNINQLRIPRLRAAAQLIGLNVDGMKRAEILKTLMQETVK